MRRFVLVFFFVMSLVRIGLPSQKVPKTQIEEWQKGIVLLNYHGLSEASGFFVSEDGIIATSFHLVVGWHIFVDHYKILAVTYDKKVFHAKLLGFNRKNDILLLKVDCMPEVFFEDFDSGEKFQDCIVLGHPKGWIGYKETQIVTHFKSDILGFNDIPHPGASGSVVLSTDGKVLGMVRGELGWATLVPGVLIKIGLKIYINH